MKTAADRLAIRTNFPKSEAQRAGIAKLAVGLRRDNR